MKLFLILLAIVSHGFCKPQDVVFADDETSDGESPAPESASKDVESDDDIITRASSTFLNCDCQCDSYTWIAKGKVQGNCLSPDSTGGNFCYVSGRAAQACRDVQISTTRKDSFSEKPKLYSYEACSTPNRNQCQGSSSPNVNFGEGDFVPGGGINGRPTVSGGSGSVGGYGPFGGSGQVGGSGQIGGSGHVGGLGQIGGSGLTNGPGQVGSQGSFAGSGQIGGSGSLGTTRPNTGYGSVGIRNSLGEEENASAPEETSDSSAIKFGN